MILNCHVIFQDHVIKVQRDFIGKNQSWSVTILPSFAQSERRYTSLVCHVVQQTARSKGHVILLVGAPSGTSPPCQAW